jgi:predicted kinase
MTYKILKELLEETLATQFNMSRYVEVIPSLAKLKTCPQDNIFHAEGNVYIHTEMVVNALLNDAKFQSLSFDEKFICFYACLLHDIGKPLCTKEEFIDGRMKITSRGHSKVGEIDTRIMLYQMEVPFEVRESIANIIAIHQYPFYLIDKDNAAYLAHKMSMSTPLHLLSLVASADATGRLTNPPSLIQTTHDNIELFNQLCIEEQCFTESKKFANPFTQYMYFQKNGTIVPNEPFFETEDTFDVFIMSGIPASGKNTYIETHFSKLPMISYDGTREKMKLKYGENDGLVAHQVLEEAKEFLRQKQSFVWNATHLSQSMRARPLDLLYKYQAKPNIIYVEEPFDIVMKRNKQRDTSLTNKKIESMLLQWEIPTQDESFRVKYAINENSKKPKLKM